MENKIYKIAKGNNLGNPNSTLQESQKELIFDPDLKRIFEKEATNFYLAGLRSVVDYSRLITYMSVKNEKYIEWNKSKEAEDADAETCVKKIIECLDGAFDEKVLPILEKTKKNFEPMFERIKNEQDKVLKSGSPAQLEVIDGKLDFSNRILLEHSTPIGPLEEMQSRKDLGIVASEYFGALEKFSEGRFCSFFTKVKNNNLHENTKFSFLIDTSSPALRKLLHLDYFQFVRQKEKNDLSMYSQEDVEFLSQLHEWTDKSATADPILSNLNGSSKQSTHVALKNTNWSAIPGGIPSKYIVAIVSDIKETDYEFDHLKNIAKLFDVPVIDCQRNIIISSSKIDEQLSTINF